MRRCRGTSTGAFCAKPRPPASWIIPISCRFSPMGKRLVGPYYHALYGGGHAVGVYLQAWRALLAGGAVVPGADRLGAGLRAYAWLYTLRCQAGEYPARQRGEHRALGLRDRTRHAAGFTDRADYE